MTPPNAEKTKKKIMEAARDAFSQKGFDGATTREIAQKAGVNEVTLFRHFQNKENLLNAVIQHFSALPDLSRLLLGKMNGDLETDLNLFSGILMKAFRERSNDMRLMLCESGRHAGLRKVMGGIPAQLRKLLRSYFEQQKNAGKLNPALDSEVAAQAFLGLFFAYAINTFMLQHPLDTPLDEEAISKQFVQIFLNGIQ